VRSDGNQQRASAPHAGLQAGLQRNAARAKPRE
jgi:hypothetical protein